MRVSGALGVVLLVGDVFRHVVSGRSSFSSVAPCQCSSPGRQVTVSLGIRKVICANAIESVNARIRKAVRARGHFPNEATV